MSQYQHLVPRFYLEHFKRPKIWVADFQSGTVRARNPANVAGKAGFNDWEEQYDWASMGVTPLSLEDSYSRFEDKAARIIGQLAESAWPLTVQERFDLANFLGLQCTRGQRFRSEVATIASSNAAKWIEPLLSDNEVASEKLRQGRLLQHLVAPAQAVSPSPDLVRSFAPIAGFGFAKLLFLRKWTLAALPQDAETTFCTCDEPVLRIIRPTGSDDIAVGNADLVIAFPLSPWHSLFMQAPGQVAEEAWFDFRDALTLNGQVIHAASRWVFSASEQQAQQALAERVPKE